MQREALAISRVDPMPPDVEPAANDMDNIRACLHAFQKGLTLAHGRETKDQRIAIAKLEVLVDAIVETLISKGVCTSREFYREVVRQAQQKIQQYTEQVGVPIDDEPDTGVVL